MEQTISTEILDFLTGIHGDRNDSKDRKEKIFNRAFSLAYKDMATHTMKYTDLATKTYVSDESSKSTTNKERIREALCEYIKDDFQGLENMNETDFNKWHKKLCEKLIDIKGKCFVSCFVDRKKLTKRTLDIGDLLCHVDSEIDTMFSYGQAQKLVNMMLKYLYIYYKCEGYVTFDKIVQYFHVPIDRLVLISALNSETYKGTPWSRIKTYSEYTQCQEEINKKYPREKYSTAFNWELAEWPFK